MADKGNVLGAAIDGLVVDDESGFHGLGGDIIRGAGGAGAYRRFCRARAGEFQKIPRARRRGSGPGVLP